MSGLLMRFCWTAGLYGMRGSGPYLLCEFEHPGHWSGCPGPQSDRFAITSRRPRNRRKALCLRAINWSCGLLGCGSVSTVDLAPGHDDPGDSRGFVGYGNSGQLVGFADQQLGDPGMSPNEAANWRVDVKRCGSLTEAASAEAVM